MRSWLFGILAAIMASMMGMLLPWGAEGRDRQDRASPGDEPRHSVAEAAPRPGGISWDDAAAPANAPPSHFHRGFHAIHPEHFDNDELQLDQRIHQVARDLAALKRPAEVPAQDDAGLFSVGNLTPFSFQLMGYASIAVAMFGLIVVIRHRPKFAGVRGKNESRDARRAVVSSIVALVVINLADLAFTSLLVPTRSFVELNPLADTLTNSLPMLILVKSTLIGGGTLLLLLLWRHKIAQLASWGTAVTYVFAAIWWVMYFHAAMS